MELTCAKVYQEGDVRLNKDQEEVQISYYASRPFRNHLKVEAIKRGITVQQLIERAVTRELSGTRDEQSLSVASKRVDQDMQRWHRKLDVIFEGPFADAGRKIIDALAIATAVAPTEDAGQLVDALLNAREKQDQDDPAPSDHKTFKAS